ncbi:MAG: SGNH/GDSL hydrolase family protein [Cytophagales bacterium]|nr:MAG: SGNH/GDSL hydrolase family protein [Cytophagales bacterium]
MTSHISILHHIGKLLLILIIAFESCKSNTTPKPMNKNTKTYTLLGLGDSYTFGQNVLAEERYISQLYQMLISKKYNFSAPKIIAQTGWTSSELLENIKTNSDKNNYDFVCLLIGVNNEFRGFPVESYNEEFIKCIDTAIRRANNDPSHVFVLSIPDYSVSSFAGKQTIPNNISNRIDAYNKINQAITNEKKAHYIEITEDSRLALTDNTLIASDGLHPSAIMYKNWAEKILPLIINEIK